MAHKFIYGRNHDGYGLIYAEKNAEKNAESYFQNYDLKYYCTYPENGVGNVYFFSFDQKRKFLVFGKNFIIDDKGRKESKSILIFTMDKSEIRYCLENTSQVFNDNILSDSNEKVRFVPFESFHNTYFFCDYYKLCIPLFIEKLVSAIINRRTLYIKTGYNNDVLSTIGLTAISSVIKSLPVSLRRRASFLSFSDMKQYHFYSAAFIPNDLNIEGQYIFDFKQAQNQTAYAPWAKYMASAVIYNMKATLKSQFFLDNRDIKSLDDMDILYWENIKYREKFPIITQSPERINIITKNPELYKTIIAQYLEYNIYNEHREFLTNLNAQTKHGTNIDYSDYLISKNLPAQDIAFFMELFRIEKPDALQYFIDQLETSESYIIFLQRYYFYHKNAGKILNELQSSYLEAVFLKALKNTYNIAKEDLDEFDFAEQIIKGAII